MKTFKQFNEESRQIVEMMGYNQNPLGPLTVAGKVIGGTVNLAKKGYNLASRVLNSGPARAYYGGQAAYDTGKSIARKEPWYQSVAKGMTGYFAKKHGGLRRGAAGYIGSQVLPGNKDNQ